MGELRPLSKWPVIPQAGDQPRIAESWGLRFPVPPCSGKCCICAAAPVSPLPAVSLLLAVVVVLLGGSGQLLPRLRPEQ